MAKLAINFRITHPVKTNFGTYEPYPYKFESNSPEISLPLDFRQIDTQGIKISELQQEILQKNGFVLAEAPKKSFLSHYDKDSTIPFFVTTDVFIHTFHCVIDKMLKRIETQMLSENLYSFLMTLLKKMQGLYDSVSTDALKNAIENNVAYLAVQLSLLDENFKAPNLVKKIVKSELHNIKRQTTAFSAIAGYDEDFSQYKARGHYTESVLLQNYFKAMMYAGRMSIRYEPAKPKERNLHQMRRILSFVSVFTPELWKTYQNINRIITYFFGESDDISLEEMETVWRELGSHVGDSLADESIVDTYIKAFTAARLPKINTVLGLRGDVEGVRGFSFFGQKFTWDSYIFQELVYDKVEKRYRPYSLDIFSVFGSKQAQNHLHEEEKYPGYTSQIDVLREKIGSLSEEEWVKSLYSQWIYTLLALHIPPEERSPYFMYTSAWQDKCLLTSLGSWTELRYDSILYAKQPTMIYLGGGGPRKNPQGYVEPNPEFFGRLYSMVKYLHEGISSLEITIPVNQVFINFRRVIKSMIRISIKELQGEHLDERDIAEIKMVGLTLETVASERNPAIAADVYTNPYHKQVMEEAIGYPQFIYVAVPDPNPQEKLRLTRGVVYTHYEFMVDMQNRLTKSEWNEILKKKPPETHDWVKKLLKNI